MALANSRGMFSVSVEYGPTQVLIACVGPATVAEMCGALAFGGEIAKRAGRPQFVFDLLAVDFRGTSQDRQEMGRFAATMLAGMKRIAVVVAAAQYTGEGERAAREAGLAIRNFDDLNSAIGWLDA